MPRGPSWLASDGCDNSLIVGSFQLGNISTDFQVADLLTKPFTSPVKWSHAQRLIGIGPTRLQPAADRKARALADAVPAQNAPNQGGRYDRMSRRVLLFRRLQVRIRA